MNQLTAVIAVGALALCANASETVTLKRDVLGRAIGATEKKTTVLKKTASPQTTPQASPSSFTFMGPIYESMAELYNPYEPSLKVTTTASFINDNSTGYEDTFVFNSITGNTVNGEFQKLTANQFENYARDYEKIYHYYDSYYSPGIALPAGFNTPYDGSTYTYNFQANAPIYQQNYVCLENGCYMTRKGIMEATKADEAMPQGYLGAGVSIHLSTQGFAHMGYANSEQNGYCQNTRYRGRQALMENSYNTALVKEILPFAGVYVYDAVCDNENGYYNRLPDEPWDRNIMVGVHSYSAIGFQNSTQNKAYSTYDEEAAIMDEYIYHNRIVEFTTMNGRNNYGASLNAISVAGIYGYENKLTDHENKNPRLTGTGREIIKPEIANYTYLHLDSRHKFKIWEGSSNREYDAATSSESAAAVYSAAMAAGLLSKNPFYKWHPEVVKALFISASVDDVANNRFQKNNKQGSTVVMGMRRPIYDQLIRGNRSRYWIGDNEAFFENNVIKVTEKNLVKGKRYRLAIAWLNRGSYTMANKNLQQDLDLTVTVTKANGNKTNYTSNSSYNAFEVVEFENPTNKDVEVQIKRYSNNGGRVLLGYNLHEVE